MPDESEWDEIAREAWEAWDRQTLAPEVAEHMNAFSSWLAEDHGTVERAGLGC